MTPPPRARRLEREYEAMLALSGASSLITFVTRGSPPTSYDVTLSCGGLVKDDIAIIKSFEHRFSLTLDDAFPIAPPNIIWKTPIFHPNFSRPHVCTGDIWFPALSLAQLCTSLCEHVQYKYFNIYDPLDIDAARWLEAFLRSDDPEIPIDKRPVIDPDFPIH